VKKLITTSFTIIVLCFRRSTADEIMKNTAKNDPTIKSLKNICETKNMIIPGIISSMVKPKNKTDLLILK